MQAGVSRQVSLRWGNFYRADLTDADVVYAYVTSSQAKRLRACLETRLKPGTRVVTVSSDLDGWQPAAIDRADLVFLYLMPPWQGQLPHSLQRIPGLHDHELKTDERMSIMVRDSTGSLLL
jgi:hypothetical protein